MTNHPRLSGALAICVGLVGLPSVAAPTYTVHDLGQGVEAADLNANGRVVGTFNPGDGSFRAFITGDDGVGMTLLGTLGGPRSHATGVNSTGRVVGYSYTTNDIKDGPRHAFITGANGTGMTDLGTLGGISSVWGEFSVATDVNDAGQVVGTSYLPSGYERVFVVDAAGGAMRPLNIDGYTTTGAVTNASGQVAGMYNKDGDGKAFLAGDFGVRTIDTGAAWNPVVLGINDRGQLVGEARYPDGIWPRGFVTGPNGNGMTDIGTLGGLASAVLGINSAGEGVGEASTADGFRHAVLIGADGAGMLDLNDSVTLAGGAYMYAAVAINDRGQIVANSGNGHAYLLTPVPEPGTSLLMLIGVTALGASTMRRKHTALT